MDLNAAQTRHIIDKQLTDFLNWNLAREQFTGSAGGQVRSDRSSPGSRQAGRSQAGRQAGRDVWRVLGERAI